MRSIVFRSLRVTLLTLLFAAGALAAGHAEAQPVEDVEEPASASVPAPATPWRGELVGGVDGPLGSLGAALVYEPRPWLAVGGGFGVGLSMVTPSSFGADKLSGDLAAGVFARANVLRAGRLTLGPVVTASLSQRRAHIEGAVGPANVTWTWSPAPRFDVGLGAEVALGGWALRLEGGLGVVAGDPTCLYAAYPGMPFPYEGSCDSTQIPAEYHFSRYPGRLAPYLTLGVARVAEGPHDELPAQKNDPRADFAFLAPTALTQPKGTVTLSLYELLMLRATFALTDRVQISAGLALTVFAGWPAWELGIKIAVFEAGRLHLALAAEHLGVQGAWSGSLVMGGGAVATYCLDDGCASMVSTSVLAGVIYSTHDEGAPDTEETGVLISPSFVLALARRLKAVAELHIIAAEPRDGAWLAGLRVPFPRFAIDLGAVGDLRSGELAPVGALSARW
jgi:hypothetical protein